MLGHSMAPRRALSWVLLVAGFAAFGACHRKREPLGAVKRSEVAMTSASVGQAVPAEKLVAATFRFRIGVYHAEEPTINVAKELQALAHAAQFAVVTDDRVAKPATASTSVRLTTPTIEQYEPPSEQLLESESRGLNAEDQRALRASRAATVLEFSGPGENAIAAYKKALELTLALAKKIGGYLWDDETRNAFTVASFQARLEDWKEPPVVSRHVTLHLYREGDLLRIVSLGMVKFGLPDVAVRHVSSSNSSSMATLVNFVCQSLLERGKLDREGILIAALGAIQQPTARDQFSANLKANAKRVVEVALTKAVPEEGDAENRLIELAFPGPVDTLQERHNQTLTALFGSEDSITHVAHNAELLAASERARKKAFELRPRFAKSPPVGEELLVKAPFATPAGNNEWMWVEVVRWDGDTIHGILANDPFEVPGLKAGARVDVKADEIFDYILKDRKGTTEGNSTGAILERLQSAKKTN